VFVGFGAELPMDNCTATGILNIHVEEDPEVDGKINFI
jgi:hypothetical protein